MNIFIIGPTHIGKTTLAENLAKLLNMEVISASEWVKQRFPRAEADKNKKEFTDKITALSIELLAEDPFRNSDFIKRRYCLEKGGFIIEGVRNPHCFHNIYHPKNDIVIFLRNNEEISATVFEGDGISVIEKSIQWFVGQGIVSQKRVYFFVLYNEEIQCSEKNIYHLKDISCVFPILSQDLFLREEREKKPQDISAFVHKEISPMKMFLRKEFLYDLNSEYVGQYVRCFIFAISSYKGHAPTFQCQVGDGEIFSYLPAHAFLAFLPDVHTFIYFEHDELVYHNCPSEVFSLHVYDFLKGTVNAFFKKRNIWRGASYLFTIEWYENNDLLHCLLLENGQIALLPQHKIRFSESTEVLPQYKKLHKEWKVE